MTTAFINGRILTMDESIPNAAVVVVHEEEIVAVGEEALLNAYPDAERYDLGGKLLIPGFIDAHCHLSIAALHPRWANLEEVHTLDALREALRKQAQREPEAQWIRGYQWMPGLGGPKVTRHDLDQMGFDRPVILAHFTLHQGLVDSRGLELLGIDRRTVAPKGGVIVHDRQGEPTGRLLESAWSEANARSLAAYGQRERWGELVAQRGRTLLADGVTAVHDAACSPAAEGLYRSMAARGDLPISVLAMPHPATLFTNRYRTRLDGPLTGDGDAWFRVGPIKLFADNGTSGAIRATRDGEPVEIGEIFSLLPEGVLEATRKGFRVAVHALGNFGVERALEAFAEAQGARPGFDHRFRLEHVGLASSDQIARMAELGVIGVVQPGFVDAFAHAGDSYRYDGIGLLPFGEMAAKGVRLAASSDDPCVFSGPIGTALCGATRRSRDGIALGPEQALPLSEWIRGYTINAAFAGGQEHERGSLTPGKRADLVLLDGALQVDNPPRVVETWVAGAKVWSDASAAPADSDAGSAQRGTR